MRLLYHNTVNYAADVVGAAVVALLKDGHLALNGNAAEIARVAAACLARLVPARDAYRSFYVHPSPCLNAVTAGTPGPDLPPLPLALPSIMLTKPCTASRDWLPP